ncbi:hypothetical protein [Actibacterium lipolyticum]|uniref:Uncharacterized protein n=1 Tax=Actibacterium lipolyticum TaxID=1524263 RepID=A0A238JY22_9RHOB|nr:hypothetical protein [Actibacterium lipolyticum]SMX35024.1 hypothetical protein COL8621_01611 [Actibacterium lipolyticum]
MEQIQCRPHLRVASNTDRLSLVVGMPVDDVPHDRGSLEGAKLEYLPYALIHAALTRVPMVETIVAPLVSDQFDALDLAHELDRAGYRGRLMIVTPRLPRPEMIKRELASICPNVKVHIASPATH